MTAGAVNLHVTSLQSSLQQRLIRSTLPLVQSPWQLVHLRSGTVSYQVSRSAAQDAEVTLEAPALVCWPNQPVCVVKIQAGSSGVHLAVSETSLAAALGNRPESYELHDMLRGFVALSLIDLPDSGDRAAQALEAIAQEHAAGQAGHQVVIEAQLRCLLIHVWRQNHQAVEAPNAVGPQIILLRRFRQLVEAHFRERWKVADYALALNSTPDRLHNITTHVLRRTPLALVHDRCHLEARALLTRTNLSLDQVAAQLGFRTTPQFSSFFRKMEGLPPGKYRAASLAHQNDMTEAPDLDFSDWP